MSKHPSPNGQTQGIENRPDTPSSASVPEEVQTREHELKTWPEYFNALLDGRKTFEYRRNDRGFRVGDTLHLREYSSLTGHYSGREMRRRVTYVLSTDISSDYVVLALDQDAAEQRGRDIGVSSERAKVSFAQPTSYDFEAVPAWFQIQAGSELSRLVEIVRFAPGQSTGFLHNSHDASGLLWRWALRFFTPKALASPPSSVSPTREQKDKA